MLRTASLFVACLVLAAPVSAQAKEKPKWPPSPHVAATAPLRPEDQIKKMKLPPGFELQLVAADPDIRKPININFDAAGRLWITETIEYPYAAKDGKGRDAVKILEDFGPDGKARKITTFADGLNIPIGVIPTSQGALVYSIPSIYHMTDSKGLGKADKREVYYTQFGTQDTHGMTGEFQQGFDGWIYACHGFANTSKVKSKGDTAITMQSGNTYRIKADGSRIEQHTWGQVNPFGLAFDPLGNLYSGDCHSRPLTMLLRHAWYESFAKPHDGLGFAPHMNTFDNHSTALCGVAYYAADQYPKEWHGMLFLGDVVLNRINAYELQWTGASPKAVMKPFLTSSDPWFRPVDIKLGPDGCLYFADFYNRVIGHYEVPLDHPGRDRDKGRIWRIVYKNAEPRPVTNLAKADVLRLVESLGNANLTVRLQATHQLVERGAAAVPALEAVVKNVADAGDGAKKVHALWALERLGKLSDDTLAEAVSAKEREVRVHAQRILTEKPTWSPKYAAMARQGLNDTDAAIKRVAAEAMAAHPSPDQVVPLADLISYSRNSQDTHLNYALRLALRAQLRVPTAWKVVNQRSKFDKGFYAIIAEVCLGVHDEESAKFLLAHMKDKIDLSYDKLRDYSRYAVRHGPENSFGTVLGIAKTKGDVNLVAQATVMKAALQAAQERGLNIGAKDRDEAEAMVIDLLDAPPLDVKQSGAELAGMLKLPKVLPRLLVLVTEPKTPAPMRQTCITSLVNIDAKGAMQPLTEVLLNEKETIGIREQVANALAAANQAEAHAALVKALQSAPARLQTTIALGMAGSPQGGDRLLQAIEAGKASPRLLQDQAIAFRLAKAKIANVKDRLNKLTQGLPTADQKTQELIAKRRASFFDFKADVEVGQKLFAKHCANCHQISGEGAKVGPNLDGIGSRGLERLLEDVLDPNRNVDQAFRTTVIVTKGGKTESGLFLREEGKVVILADRDGKEVRIDKANIDERSLSPLSPMPGNVAELLSEPELHQVMAYLLTQKGK